MSKKLCVYTCITGNYDKIHEIEHPEKNIDYYCFTNNPNLKSKTWKIIQIKNESLNDHYLSRKIKMLGHPIISKNYETSIWMDASVSWDKSITEFVKTYLKNSPFAAFKHHARNSIQDEAATCLIFQKDTKENILRTLNFLKKEKFPDTLGLYEMTVFIKKHNDPIVIKTMQIWFDTIQKYSKRDQLCFMYSIWKTGLKVDTIDLSVWDNTWFHTFKHLSNPEIKDCCIYYGSLNQTFDFKKFNVYPYQKAQTVYEVKATIPNDTEIITIIPSDCIGLCYSDITIKPHPKQITTYGIIEQTDDFVSCTNYHTITINGSFKKAQRLLFTFTSSFLNSDEMKSLIEKQWAANKSLIDETDQLKKENSSLIASNTKISNDFQKIINSKGWRLLEKLRKVILLFRRSQ